MIHIRADWAMCMASEDSTRMERLSSMLRRRGIVAPAFETYGGVAGLIDYGPIGASIRRKVLNAWLDYWCSAGDILEIESPTITPEQVLVASGHVGEFNDLMTSCLKCKSAYRADHLIEGTRDDAESLDADQVTEILDSGSIQCPGCGESSWEPCSPMNLMFKTSIGAMGSGRVAYLRPETAQGMFMQYNLLYRHFRQKLPFGGVQTGKGYRNEISPRQGMIRLREFTMAELEYFFDPERPPTGEDGDWSTSITMIPNTESSGTEMSISAAMERGIILHPTVAWFLARTLELVMKLGIRPDKLRFRQHRSDEMAHYAADCWDLELQGEHGWIECVGIANRTCHDLEQHATHSGKNDFRAWRPFDAPRVREVDRWVPIQAKIGPEFKQASGKVTAALESLSDVPDQAPFDLHLEDGSVVTISEDMVERRMETVSETGEWYIPHVVEPAFGIDRIIWHILDHSYQESEKEGEMYTIMRLPQLTAPYDAVVLPLFDKDGMDSMAEELRRKLSSKGVLKIDYDNSKSIGRRYARADEVGIPWAVTVDHQSLLDNTVTIRRRDDGSQERVNIEDLMDLIVGSRQELKAP